MSEVASTEALRRRVASLVWTNHNVEIAPGVWTVPHEPPLLRVLVRTRGLRRAAKDLTKT